MSNNPVIYQELASYDATKTVDFLKLDIPNGSRICLFNEPSGATLAMIQAAKQSAIAAPSNNQIHVAELVP
jgi:hypothetical protein